MRKYKHEKDLEADIRRALEFVPDVIILPKLVSTQEKGIPDIMFTYNGRSIAWECKMKGKALTTEQRMWKMKATYNGWRYKIIFPKTFENDTVLNYIENKYGISKPKEG